jgi:hypothetical protein
VALLIGAFLFVSRLPFCAMLLPLCHHKELSWSEYNSSHFDELGYMYDFSLSLSLHLSELLAK